MNAEKDCEQDWARVSMKDQRSTYIHVDIQHGDLRKHFRVELHGLVKVLFNVLLSDVLRYPGLQDKSELLSCDTKAQYVPRTACNS